MNELVLVLDFGGQYKELIARRVRGLSVYSEIKPGNLPLEEIRRRNPIGIILTGGPASVYLPDSPRCDPGIFDLGIPVLGICYGMQLMCHLLGGRVEPCIRSEYGRVQAEMDTDSPLFQGLPRKSAVLMSHTDRVVDLPQGFEAAAHTADCAVAACQCRERGLYGVQFHPETELSQYGGQVLEHFLYRICGAKGDYHLDDYIQRAVAGIRNRVGGRQVLLALSGGVDSSVCAALLSKAIPGQATCVFVDHGFMRLNEGDEIQRAFANSEIRMIRVNAQERFLRRLEGIRDPETKRKIIGAEFVRVFEEQARELGAIPYLAQGTIYPDVIESGGELGATIKSHHNVGGLPTDLAFDGVIEPLSGLFKDEVRELGKRLGLPSSLVNRQPFPGPGLAIRIMGEVTEKKLDTLRQADHILCDEIARLRRKPQQYFAVLTDTYSVGVKGDDRIYEPVIALRAVTTSDFMTCEYTPISHRVLGRIASRIANQVPGVSRVVYDITSKPPATIEWE